MFRHVQNLQHDGECNQSKAEKEHGEFSITRRAFHAPSANGRRGAPRDPKSARKEDNTFCAVIGYTV